MAVRVESTINSGVTGTGSAFSPEGLTDEEIARSVRRQLDLSLLFLDDLKKGKAIQVIKGGKLVTPGSNGTPG